jgi:mRNA interferase MazF
VAPRRGEVWLLDLGEPIGREQAGRRPAVIVSDDEVNDGPSGLVIVVPLTSTRRELPSHIELDSADSGLDEVSYAKCEDIESVSERRLVTRLGAAPTPAMFQIERVLRILLAL